MCFLFCPEWNFWTFYPFSVFLTSVCFPSLLKLRDCLGSLLYPEISTASGTESVLNAQVLNGLLEGVTWREGLGRGLITLKSCLNRSSLNPADTQTKLRRSENRAEVNGDNMAGKLGAKAKHSSEVLEGCGQAEDSG